MQIIRGVHGSLHTQVMSGRGRVGEVDGAEWGMGYNAEEEGGVAIEERAQGQIERDSRNKRP